MGEKVKNQTGDVNMTNIGITFDNLIILKEFNNIVNLVRVEDFLETVPKSKLRRIKWVPMFNYLQQGILDEMIQEMNSMWECENMPEKLKSLEKQKEKFAEINSSNILWRPQLGDVKAQLRARDISALQKQKKILETLAKDYECRVNTLKNNITAKRGYLKALQMDIRKYQKKNEDFIAIINEKFERHRDLTNLIIPTRINVNEIKWSEKDLESDIKK